MDRTEFMVHSTGSSTGSTVLMNTSTAGRRRPRRARSGTRLMGFILEAWFSSQLRPNHRSPTTVIHHRTMLSESRCLMRHAKKLMIRSSLAKFSNLGNRGTNEQR